MTDPTEAVRAAADIAPYGTAILAAKGLKSPVNRAFGPALDAFGSGVGSWVERKFARAERIRDLAEEAVGETGGTISERVVDAVLLHGTSTDDELVLHYMAGVVAGTLTFDREDDSAVGWVALIGRLSTDALALHYFAYDAWAQEAIDCSTEIDAADGTVLERSLLYIPASSMPFDEERAAQAIMALSLEGLVGKRKAIGSNETLQKVMVGRDLPSGGGLAVSPTFAGIELFLRGLGRSPHTCEGFGQLLDPSWDRTLTDTQPARATGARLESELPSL